MKQEPVKILLVDDQPAKLLSYVTILEQLGETLITAGSAQEAFEHLLKKEVAVILVDVIMPELDGFELARMVRDHPRFQTTAIIFVSAFAMTDLDLLKGYEHGGVDFLPVPVIPELMRAKVRVFCELYRKRRELERLNAELERRVGERTAELAQANAELERRVEERTREREHALAQVHEMQKLESLGQLTGGVAHDFNNVLMAVLGNLELLSKRAGDPPAARRLIDGATKAAERGATLTQRMLAFARRQELRPEAVDAARHIGGLVEMLRRSLGPSIAITVDCEKDLPPIKVDPNQLELSLLNLALNARDAMPDGGNLTIAAHRPKFDPDVIPLRPGEYVCLSVADTGSGMDEATLKRAPEPFFTTKGVGKGTGLGLSMVYGLAAQSGGLARISSRLGDGTTVELWLPATEPAPGAAAENPAEPAAPRSDSYSILLVDDDPLVLEATGGMLGHLGHRVTVAGSGAEALDVMRDTPVDLLITDYAMPGMTGVELIRQIRQARPTLPVILATGFAELVKAAEPTLPRLDKPYRLEALRMLLQQTMDAAKPQPAAAQHGAASV
jgi:signal transduction histidine kinase